MSSFAALIKIVAKKLGMDLLTDTDKGMKFISLILGVVLSMCLLFAAPAYLLFNFPSLLWEYLTDSIFEPERLETIDIYKKAADEVYRDALDWVDDTKRKYSYADPIETSFNFSVSWRELVAIDAIRLEQDYTKTKLRDVKSVAQKFLYTDVRTEKYTTYEEFTDKLTGKTTKIEVEKTRAIISVSKIPIDRVLDSLKFTEEEKLIVLTMIDNISAFDIEGVGQ